MDDQERRNETPSNGAHEVPFDDQAEERADEADTQVGPAVPALARVTRQLTAVSPKPSPSAARRVEQRAVLAATRERVAALVAALGDPANPLHQGAVDDLVAIGEPAVPALNDSLNANRPWLTAYRAAEALGQIGDGRAAGALLEALRHPNSNVRWSAVRALAVVGDARALLDLRRVAREDRGKTSWGEPVAGAAQSALNQMQSQNMLLRGADLIKTAVACVLMLVALIVAWKIVGDLRTELRRVGLEQVDASVLAAPTAAALPTTAPIESSASPAPETAAEPTAAPAQLPSVTGTVRATGNVRAQPQVSRNNVIGGVTEGDEVVFLAVTPDGQWYRIRLGERRSSGSRIEADGGDGWVNRSLLSAPTGEVPVEEASAAQPDQTDAAPTAAP